MPYFGTAPEALLQGFASLSNLEIHVISCTQEEMASPEKLANNIWFHSLHVPKIGWLRTGYQGCIRKVRRLLQQIQPDMVHGQGTERDCAISAVFSGFPNVITIHGNMRLISAVNRASLFSYQWFAARLEGFTIPRSNGVICITNYTKRAVEQLARKTWLAPNAVNSAFFQVQCKPETPPVILCVGTISWRKNQNAFIRALDPLASRHEFRLVLLGDGNSRDPYMGDFQSLVKTRPWCEFLGFADRKTLRDWIGRAYLLALPSLEDNCPMVVLEAAAAGLPIVAGNVGGVPDLIVHGATGLLCNPADSESMMQEVERLLLDQPFANRLAQSARSQAWQKFRPEVIAERHVEIYREVLSGSR